MSRVLASKNFVCENKRGVAHVLLTIMYPTYKRSVVGISLVCHAPFISIYSRASKCLLASNRDVELERYRTSC